MLADGYYEWKTEGKQKQPYYFRAAATPFWHAEVEGLLRGPIPAL